MLRVHSKRCEGEVPWLRCMSPESKSKERWRDDGE